jgi:protein PhnA
MSDHPVCPKCDSSSTYQDMILWVCLECANEWDPNVETPGQGTESPVAKKICDANGNELNDGDSVVLIKDLKVKGRSDLKVGTKVKNIRLIESDDGHDIDCKIDGFGGMYLKSEFVKKV